MATNQFLLQPDSQNYNKIGAHSLAPAIASDDSDDSSNHSSSNSISPLPQQDIPSIIYDKHQEFIEEYNKSLSKKSPWNLITIILCITYLILSTQMPFYNKIALEIYSYPITSCLFQIIGVVLILIITSWIIYYYQNNNKRLSIFHYFSNLFCNGYFLIKCKYLILPSLFFSFNIILTNIGIELTSIDLHILFRSTEIIWFVLLTPILTNDKPTKQAIIAAFLVTIGSTLLAFSTMNADDISLSALIINILSAFFTPLQIIFLKRATYKLNKLKFDNLNININNTPNLYHDIDDDDHNENQNKFIRNVMTKQSLSRDEIIEITCIKMLLSLIFILPASLIVEKPKAFNDLIQNYGIYCNLIILIIGIIVTLLMQWNVVALTSKVEPVLIGTLQQSKGIWTYLVSLIVGGVAFKNICGCTMDIKCGKDYPSCPCFKNVDNEFVGDFAIPHIIGVIAIILGMIYYTVLKYKNNTTQYRQ